MKFPVIFCVFSLGVWEFYPAATASVVANDGAGGSSVAISEKAGVRAVAGSQSVALDKTPTVMVTKGGAAAHAGIKPVVISKGPLSKQFKKTAVDGTVVGAGVVNEGHNGPLATKLVTIPDVRQTGKPNIVVGVVNKNQRTTGKPVIGDHDDDEDEDGSIDEMNSFLNLYNSCGAKCKGKGVKVECGVNGYWFVNSCQRECAKVQLSRSGDKECNPNEKKDLEGFWKCHGKCDAEKEKRQCGEDGTWYENGCRRDCYGVKQTDATYCQRLDKEDECHMKCFSQKKEQDCGTDGEWYPNTCYRECLGVKPGKEGKECESRDKLEKYWNCQEECFATGTKEQCGKSGHMYQNDCHLKCNGDTLGVLGKDCKT